jgi:hypothetical protein
MTEAAPVFGVLAALVGIADIRPSDPAARIDGAVRSAMKWEIAWRSLFSERRRGARHR